MAGSVSAPVDIGSDSSAQKSFMAHVNEVASNLWYRSGKKRVNRAVEIQKSIKNKPGSARNIILFIGDGMSISTVTAARILDGQKQGFSGEENFLSFGQFPYTGMIKTYNVDAQTPDSAGTMTAIMSGVKTDFGVLGVDEDVVRGDCRSQKGHEVISALALAEIAGLSSGVVTTSRITHATPAATFAVSVERGWEDISKMPESEIAAGCEDIASQLIHFESNLEKRYPSIDVDGIEVVLGGGAKHFLPKLTNSDLMYRGSRTDQRNLINEWKQIYGDVAFVTNASELEAVDPKRQKHIFGLFSESHMRYEADRIKSGSNEPSLTQMTEKAISMLEDNPNGFFLVIESGRIDHAHHANNAYNALWDTIELSKAVKSAVNLTQPSETLVIVTSDHGHVMSIAGYPRRGNPILGKVISVGKSTPALDKDGLPYTTIGYQNGPGFLYLGEETNADVRYSMLIDSGRHNLDQVDTEVSGFHQESQVPLSAETHSGEDVVLYATGPGAHLATGTMEQSAIFNIMNYAGNLTEKARATIHKKR